MSENQQPLTEEELTEQTAAPDETTALAAQDDAPEDALCQAQEAEADAAEDGEAEAAEEEEEDIDPADVRIFGMPRVCFHLTAFGVAAGYIVCGLLGMAGFTPPNATICAVLGGAIGYFVGDRLYKKRKAERDAAAAQAAEAEQAAE